MTVTKPTGMRSPVDHGDRHQPPLVGLVGFPLGALEGERIFDRPRRDLHRRPVGKNSFTRKPSVARADQSLVMSGHFFPARYSQRRGERWHERQKLGASARPTRLAPQGGGGGGVQAGGDHVENVILPAAGRLPTTTHRAELPVTMAPTDRGKDTPRRYSDAASAQREHPVGEHGGSLVRVAASSHPGRGVRLVLTME